MGVEKLPGGWIQEGSRLVRRIELDDYSKVVVAGLCISSLAMWRNHHPRLIVEYHALTVELSSHDVGAVTDRDLDLAQWINAMIPPFE